MFLHSLDLQVSVEVSFTDRHKQKTGDLGGYLDKVGEDKEGGKVDHCISLNSILNPTQIMVPSSYPSSLVIQVAP